MNRSIALPFKSEENLECFHLSSRTKIIFTTEQFESNDSTSIPYHFFWFSWVLDAINTHVSSLGAFSRKFFFFFCSLYVWGGSWRKDTCLRRRNKNRRNENDSNWILSKNSKNSNFLENYFRLSENRSCN